MNSETTIDDIEYIINKYDFDHTMAYLLIDEIIRNYRIVQLNKFQYEQNEQNKQKQLPVAHNIMDQSLQPIVYSTQQLLANKTDINYNYESNQSKNNNDYEQINNFYGKLKISNTKTTNTLQIPLKSKIIECLCCFDLFSDDEITMCSEGHIFVRNVLKNIHVN